MANDKVTIKLEADIAAYQANMKRAGDVTASAMSGMQRSADAARAAMAGLAQGAISALSVAAFVNAAKGVADYTDEMGKMSQRVGVAVEQLSGLTYAAGLSDVSNEALGTGLKKLSKLMAEAAGGMEQQKRILKELGVTETQDANKAFLQLADRFSTMEEGAGKTAAAMAVFGKSGTDLLPMLNSGADGIRAATDEAARFGLIVGKDAADAAEKFNDNLTRLAALTKGAQVSLFGDLVIGIGNATQAFLDGVRDGNKWRGMIAGIQTLLTGDDRHKNNVALVEDTDKLLTAEKALAGARASGMDPRGIAAREKAVSDLKERIRVTMNYRKVLDEEETKEAAAKPAKTGKVNSTVFRPGNTGTTGTKPAQTDAQKLEADAQRFVARLKEQADTYGKLGAAQLASQQAFQALPKLYQDQAMAQQLIIDGLKEKEAATKAAVKADLDGFKAMDDLRKDDQDAQKRNEANVEAIRIGLMSEADQQVYAHEMILAELQTFHDAKFENVALANALMEEENARHQQALADAQAQASINMVGMMANSADQLYNMLKQAGQEQSALGKIAFIASKALGVAQIILSTNVAAATALMPPPMGLGPLAGIPFASAIKAMGYASAGMTAGLAIAQASAEGGYDIPSGVNPVTQLHEREMVLPKAQADVIRGLASNGGGGGGALALTIVNQTSGRIDRVTEQRISPTERALIIQEAVGATAAQLGDPNSKTSRSMARNFSTQRSR